VPTVAGEVCFDDAYEGNPLVNAMSVGVVDADQTASAVTGEPGNAVYIVGSATGRDGIHGATFASEEIDEDSEERRPSVQVGDPFQEKLLLEATLEAIQAGAVVGVQDMGAAGITSSTFEMTASSDTGMELHLDRVPTREDGMTPYEIMLSESQERMLIVCRPDQEDELRRIFDKWDLDAEHVGTITDTGRVRAHWHGDVVADLDPKHLAAGEGAPVYERDTQEPAYLQDTRAFQTSDIEDVSRDDVQDVFLDLLQAPNIASKRWVYEQYDTMVRTNTVVGPGPSDAAVMRLKGTDRGLAVKTDCNGRYVYLNPRRGAQLAVAEAARNVACAGGRPVAITNCLNFGNPYKPEVYWTFAEAVRGIGDACRALGTPVTGGNVSFYNEHPEGAVFPTPTIGMLGLVDDITHATTAAFQDEGDAICLLRPAHEQRTGLGGSEYLRHVHDRTTGDVPSLDLGAEKAVQDAILDLIHSGLAKSAHDVSDGGLAVALAESALFSDGHGADVDLPGGGTDRGEGRLDVRLFNEAPSRIIVSLAEGDVNAARQQVEEQENVAFTRLGTVTDGPFRCTVEGLPVIEAPHRTLRNTYEEAIPSKMRA
jgi:phosphoribosylformylglycinamidine synthase